MLHLAQDILNDCYNNDIINDFRRYEFLQNLLTEGTRIYVPEDHELTLDYDLAQVEKFGNIETAELHIHRICEDFNLRVKSVDISPSNMLGHYHGIVVLEEEVESVEKRVALQLLMGSDPVREKMVLLRTYAGTDFPCVLFKHTKPKDHVLALLQQEYEDTRTQYDKNTVL